MHYALYVYTHIDGYININPSIHPSIHESIQVFVYY